MMPPGWPPTALALLSAWLLGEPKWGTDSAGKLGAGRGGSFPFGAIFIVKADASEERAAGGVILPSGYCS